MALERTPCPAEGGRKGGLGGVGPGGGGGGVATPPYPRATGYSRQLSGWVPLDGFQSKKNVSWGSELCPLGRVFVGWGLVLSAGTQPTKKIRTRKNVENVYFLLRFQKCVLSKTELFIFSFSALGAPYRGLAH